MTNNIWSLSDLCFEEQNGQKKDDQWYYIMYIGHSVSMYGLNY